MCFFFFGRPHWVVFYDCSQVQFELLLKFYCPDCMWRAGCFHTGVEELHLQGGQGDEGYFCFGGHED